MSKTPSSNIPENTLDLIAWLEETFPPKCIGSKQSPEEAHRYAGKVELVLDLKTRFEHQTQRALQESMSVRST